MADYELLLRNPRTLALIAPLAKYVGATWTRRTLEAGSFKAVLHKDQLDSASDIDRNNIFEVHRDGAFEFAGVIRKRNYNAIDQEWTIAGRDLKGFWLSGREIDPGVSEFDTQAGVIAETAMHHYVTDHLTNPSDGDRKVSSELTGLTFDVGFDAAKGSSVDFNVRWENLLKVLVEIGERGNVWHDVAMISGGYEYQVYDPTDATEGTGTTPVIFSVGWDNVGESVYEEDYLRVANAVYVLADGSGASRTVREVEDAASITADFRREAHLDARQADTNAKRDEQGNLMIARTLADARTARMAPLTVADEQYRTDWDLGYDVTLAFTDISQTLDKRIDQITVTLSRQQEKVTVGLSRPPQTLARIIADVTRRSERAQVA